MALTCDSPVSVSNAVLNASDSSPSVELVSERDDGWVVRPEQVSPGQTVSLARARAGALAGLAGGGRQPAAVRSHGDQGPHRSH